MNDYILQTNKIYFKHAVSKNLPCDAYSMHMHNMYELIYFVSGDATHIIENRKYKLKKGDLILIQPARYHFIQIDSPSDYERYDILFDIDKHNVSSVSLLPEHTEVVNISGNKIAEDIFRKCDMYFQHCDDHTFESLLSHLLYELFYNIYLFPQFSKTESTLISTIVSEALGYINENLCTIKGAQEIADHLFVTKSYLFRLFKNELHQTPKKYIMEKRLLLSHKMISAGEKPTSIYEQCGFGDYSTFYRNYTLFFGYPPSEKVQ